MNLDIKRIKNTPYKLVIGENHDILGVFDHNKFIRRECVESPEVKQLIGLYHASTLVERLEQCDG